MNTSARTVLSLTSSEAIDFVMKSEQYYGTRRGGRVIYVNIKELKGKLKIIY